MHMFEFGVYRNGKSVFIFNRIKCSHATAALIVGILDLAKDSLRPGDYFACDYAMRGEQ